MKLGWYVLLACAVTFVGGCVIVVVVVLAQWGR